MCDVVMGGAKGERNREAASELVIMLIRMICGSPQTGAVPPAVLTGCIYEHYMHINTEIYISIYTYIHTYLLHMRYTTKDELERFFFSVIFMTNRHNENLSYTFIQCSYIYTLVILVLPHI